MAIWDEIGLSQEDWRCLARAFFAVAHGDGRAFAALPAVLQGHPVGVLCAAYLERSDPALLDEAGRALCGTAQWYTYLGRMM